MSNKFAHPETGEEVVSTKDAAVELRIAYSTIMQHIRDGNLEAEDIRFPPKKTGKYIRRSKLDRFKQKRRKAGNPGPREPFAFTREELSTLRTNACGVDAHAEYDQHGKGRLVRREFFLRSGLFAISDKRAVRVERGEGGAVHIFHDGELVLTIDTKDRVYNGSFNAIRYFEELGIVGYNDDPNILTPPAPGDARQGAS